MRTISGRARVRTIAAATAAAAALATALATAGPAAAAPGNGGAKHQTIASPAPTRAALDPSLVGDRGAAVPFVEQEAEAASTNGTVIGPDRSAYTLASEASGRSAVKLLPGQWVEFTVPARTQGITVRYSIPDAPNGGGITAPLAVSVDGKRAGSMTLTSQYSWLYNLYPFTNDPNSGLLYPDWWVTECGCVPGTTNPSWLVKPYRPFHFYDEQRLMLSRTAQPGDVVRLTVPTTSPAAWTVVDLMDSEAVPDPAPAPQQSVSVLKFGADPTGVHDSADAFDAAIVWAQSHGKTVYIPAGTFTVDRHVVVDNVTITGAGTWWTTVRGDQVTLSTPAPDGSVHTGVGFYGLPAGQGGSSNVHLSGFTISGDVRERIDTDQVNGIGGAFNSSTFSDLRIDHTKVGIWLDGPMHGVQVSGVQIVDQIADGLNFHTGVTDSSVTNTFVRNTGDDGLAMWSEGTADARDVFAHDTVQTPTLANGIALYGGTDLTVADNLVADPIREGSGLHLGSRFGAQPFAGTIAVTDNTVVRAGPMELNWNIGLGAIWIYALEGSITADVEVVGDNFLDTTYNAILMVSDWGVKDLYSITNVHFKDIHIDGTGTSVLSARVAGSATFQNVDARNVGAVGINNCGSFHFTPAGSEFTVTDLGGNDGGGTTGPWLAPWELPNTITCDDRPPVVVPPAPSPWA
jgi:hypothetical protein